MPGETQGVREPRDSMRVRGHRHRERKEQAGKGAGVQGTKGRGREQGRVCGLAAFIVVLIA